MIDYHAAFESAGLLAIGELSLATGVVVGCDPFFAAIAEPWSRTIAPGRYPVELVRVDTGLYGPRNALARVLVSPGVVPARYERALTRVTGADAYSVDSGLGCFMDELAQAALVEEMVSHRRRHPDGDFYTDVLAPEFRRHADDPDNPDDAGPYAMYDVRAAALNVAMFATGKGDGVYESSWALDPSGRPLFLVTDFGVLQR